MRKYITTILAALLFLIGVSTGNGQTKKERIDDDFFGLVAGGTLSNISNYDADNLIGFQGGIYWEWKFSKKFSSLPNLKYTERGAKGKGDLPTVKLAYFSFPLMLKYSITDQFWVAAGVAWDYLLTVKSDSLTTDDFKDYDQRIPIEIGYYISDNLSLSVGYNIGLRDISESDNTTQKNNWASISLAYIIRTKRNKRIAAEQD